MQSPHGIAVCVGMPVYNGAKSLSAVLENIVAQTHRNLVIVISDNGSSDATPDICKEWAAKDERIRYFRQERTISPTDNFKFVLGKCEAAYFMWAAHDDYRDPNFIEALVAALEARPEAVLAFGDIVEYTKGVSKPLELNFATAGRSYADRLRWAALSQLHHLYGVWRTAALRRVEWTHVDWWHDTPLMMAASQVGEFIHVPGVKFHYTNNQHHFLDRRPGETAVAFAFRKLRDLVQLITVSGRTVARVAGPWRGLVASYWVSVKMGRQVRRGVGRLLFNGGQ